MRRELSVVPLFCFWFARLHLPLFPSSFPPLRRSGRGSRTNNCKAPPLPLARLPPAINTLLMGHKVLVCDGRVKIKKSTFGPFWKIIFSLVQCRIAMNTSRHVLCSRTCISVVVSLFSFRGMQCLRCVVLSLSPSFAPCQKSICAWPPAILTSLWRRREEEGVEMKRENIMRVGGLGRLLLPLKDVQSDKAIMTRTRSEERTQRRHCAVRRGKNRQSICYSLAKRKRKVN